MTGLQHLRILHCGQLRKKYPTLPESAIAPGKYADNTANGLTKCIVAYINFMGGSATRVSSTGRMLPKGVTEVGSRGMKWIPGTTRKGTADIMGVYKGIALSIEVKIGKDRQSDSQKAMELEVNRAGGRYFIAKDFESFYQWIITL